MADFRFANRRLATTNAIEEIPHVIVADIQTRRRRRQLLLEQVGIARLDLAASDKDPTVRAGELHAVLLALAIDDTARPIVCSFAPAAMNHAVGIAILDSIFARRRESVLDHFDRRLAGNLDWSIVAERPAGNVVVMSAPVSHCSTGV